MIIKMRQGKWVYSFS